MMGLVGGGGGDCFDGGNDTGSSQMGNGYMDGKVWHIGVVVACDIGRGHRLC